MRRRILIIGEHGQVAKALDKVFAARGDHVVSAGRSSLDITNPATIDSVTRDFKPHLIINAAAYTAVDKAEEDVQRAFAINRDGARHVAMSAHRVNTPVIHISTDYVFDGAKKTPYVETDEPNPLGIYGTSKRDGEAAVRAETNAYLIIRTSWVFSQNGTNFVKTILRLAAQRDEISVVDDQWGAPTCASDFASAIAVVGDAWLSTPDRVALSGIYHATGSGQTTWCRFARAIMGHSAALRGPTCCVRAIMTSRYPTAARRPENSRLNCAKLKKIFGVQLPHWETSLRTCLEGLFAVEQGTKT